MSKYLKFDEVAEHLNVKPKTIRDWTSQKKIPHHKLVGLVRYDIDEINSWLARKKVKPVSVKKEVEKIL